MVAQPADSRGRGPLVTVVIPTFNRCEWLREAIDSVVRQTFPDFRLIVSDNASGDDTAAVVDAFSDARLTYVRLNEHVGLNEHFNRCVARVSSRYLFLLPDDDVLLPDALATLVPVLESSSRVGMAHGRARNIGASGQILSAAHDMTGLDTDEIESGRHFIRESMRRSYRVHASTALIRREAIENLVFDQRDYPATDFGLWLRMALDWDIAFVAKTLAAYRIHGRTYTATSANVTSGGYVQGPALIETVRDVKLRFLREHAHRLDDVRAMRRDARRAISRELVNYAGHATLPERPFPKTVATLLECAKRTPRVVVEPGAWRLIVASILGRRAVEWIKRRRLAGAAKEVLER